MRHSLSTNNKLTVMTRKVVIRTFLFTKTNEKDANISLLGWDLAIARFHPRPYGILGPMGSWGLRPTWLLTHSIILYSSLRSPRSSLRSPRSSLWSPRSSLWSSRSIPIHDSPHLTTLLWYDNIDNLQTYSFFEVDKGVPNKTNEGRTHGPDRAMFFPFIVLDVQLVQSDNDSTNIRRESLSIYS